MRRHLSGSKSKDALDFKAEFKRIFNEEVNVRKLVRVLLKRAEQGIPWAMQEAFDRGLGKAVQFTDNKFDDGQPKIFVLERGDGIDDESGVIIRNRGYVSASELTIDGRKPLGEERARIKRLRAGIRPLAAPALPAPRRQLEAGNADDGAEPKAEGHEVTDEELHKACEEA